MVTGHTSPQMRFNPRVLAGGRDILRFIVLARLMMFQSTRPRGRTRLMGSESIEVQHWFQSTRPRGRTRPVHRDAQAPANSFNPRVLAGGRDIDETKYHAMLDVSIHASSREDATVALASARDLTAVSIHASSREDATRVQSPPSACLEVSIHASSREDATWNSCVVSFLKLVSIHASSREDATSDRQTMIGRYPVSIHASSREDATPNAEYQLEESWFQSTRPRGRTRH